MASQKICNGCEYVNEYEEYKESSIEEEDKLNSH